MSEVPLVSTCPYCTAEATRIVGHVVRALGPGWVVVKMRCGSRECGRVWHARMTLCAVHKIGDEDPEMFGAEESLLAGALLCPRCAGRNVQLSAEFGCTTVAGPAPTPVGVRLSCLCLDCRADYYAAYAFGGVLKNWGRFSIPRRG